MTAGTISVRAKGLALVPNHDAFDAGVKRYIGWRYGEVAPGSGEYGFKKTDEAEVVSARQEHVRDVKEGALFAADQATAILCGVAFDSTYGGEVKPAPVKKGSE